MNYLLDTNILLIHARRNRKAKEFLSELGLFDENRLLMSIISMGECHTIMGGNDWGERKINKLYGLFERLIVIPIAQRDIVDAYSKIELYSQGKLASVDFTPRNMGKNDLWIAATAYVTNATLVTTDKDFDHLNGRFIKVIYLDPLTLKTTF